MHTHAHTYTRRCTHPYTHTRVHLHTCTYSVSAPRVRYIGSAKLLGGGLQIVMLFVFVIFVSRFPFRLNKVWYLAEEEGGTKGGLGKLGDDGLVSTWPHRVDTPSVLIHTLASHASAQQTFCKPWFVSWKLCLNKRLGHNMEPVIFNM